MTQNEQEKHSNKAVDEARRRHPDADSIWPSRVDREGTTVRVEKRGIVRTERYPRRK